MSESPLSSVVIVSRLFAENCYVLSLAGRSQCVVVDPGFDDDRVIEAITSRRLTPAAILLTHGHADHIAGVEAVKRCWLNCPIVIGEQDAGKLSNAVENLSAAFGFEVTSPPADKLVHEGDEIAYGGMDFLVRHTPGHSVGHVVFVYKGSSPWTVVGGDVLFREGVGRTDFPDGSFEELESSIREKLFTLPDDTVVLPGHGPSTTIGHERQFNPFVGRGV